MIAERRLRLSKNAGRAQEGLGPLKFQSWPAACTAITGAGFAGGIRRISAKSGEGGRGGVSLLPHRQNNFVDNNDPPAKPDMWAKPWNASSALAGA